MKRATTKYRIPITEEGRQHHPIGELLRTSGKINEEDIDRVIVLQRERNLRFGEAAQRMGIVSREDVDHALAQQFEYPYVLSAESNLSPLLVTAFEPFGALAELIRTLRGQLSLRWFNDRRSTISVVAPRHEMGTSVVAANLAIAFAQLGERTLLIDANLRKPSQHELFGIERPDGLSYLLAGRSQFQEVLCPISPFGSLDVLCAGALPPNPHELLSTVAFSYLIETAPAAFDVVIIDTPPLLEYPDAQIIAARATGCLMATRRHKTSLNDVETSKQLLQPTGAAIVGVVLNE